MIGRAGGEKNLKEYGENMKYFAEKSNFAAFWNSKIPFYNQILDLTIADMGDKDLVKVVEEYFNETQDSYNIIISPAFMGGYGVKDSELLFEPIKNRMSKQAYGSWETCVNEHELLNLLDTLLSIEYWKEVTRIFTGPINAVYNNEN